PAPATRFPYTTLFRSRGAVVQRDRVGVRVRVAAGRAVAEDRVEQERQRVRVDRALDRELDLARALVAAIQLGHRPAQRRVVEPLDLVFEVDLLKRDRGDHLDGRAGGLLRRDAQELLERSEDGGASHGLALLGGDFRAVQLGGFGTAALYGAPRAGGRRIEVTHLAGFDPAEVEVLDRVGPDELELGHVSPP